jgi:hypothetical protein
MTKHGFFVLLLTLAQACSRKPEGPPSESTGAAATKQAADYSPRIGIAVETSSRTCVAIANTGLQTGTAVTIVSSLPPQSFQQAEISGPAKSTCPVTQEVDPRLASYEVKMASGSLQKLTPAIAVVGNPGLFSTVNSSVQSDLDQNGKTDTFRACTASDGYHLTVWAGTPLTGTLLWHGYYYEPSNPGTGPTCTPSEMKTP